MAIYREGDKVMQIKNNYRIMEDSTSQEQGEGIYNGDYWHPNAHQQPRQIL